MSGDLKNRISELAARFGGQVLFANRCGIKQQDLSRYVKGTNRPTVDKAYKIAKGAGVTVEWLLTGENADPLDIELLERSIALLEMNEGRRRVRRAARAKVIVEIYRLLSEKGDVSDEEIAALLRAA